MVIKFSTEISVHLNGRGKNDKNFFYFLPKERLGIRISLSFWSGSYTSVKHHHRDQCYYTGCFSKPYLLGWLLPPLHCRIAFRRHPGKKAQLWKNSNNRPPKQPQFKINLCPSQSCGQDKDSDSTGFKLLILPFLNSKLGCTLKNTW